MDKLVCPCKQREEVSTDIKSPFQKLYDENADEVKQTLEEIGRAGKGNLEAMKAIQEFLRKEKRMPLRLVAMQVLSKIKTNPQVRQEHLKNPISSNAPERRRSKG